MRKDKLLSEVDRQLSPINFFFFVWIRMGAAAQAGDALAGVPACS